MSTAKTFVGYDSYSVLVSGQTLVWSGSNWIQSDIFLNNIIDTTYNELYTMYTGSTLKSGQYYKITDFAQIYNILNSNYSQNQAISSNSTIVETQSGPTEELVVFATDLNKLDKQAYSLTYSQDIIYYDITGGDTNDIAYFSGGTAMPNLKGVIYYRHDTRQNVKAWYDFRNVKFRRWSVDAIKYTGGTYSVNDVFKNALDNKIYKCKISGSTTPDFSYWQLWLDVSTNDKWSWTSNKTYFCIGNINTTNLIIGDTCDDYYTFGDYYSLVNNIDLGKISLNTLIGETGYNTTINNIVFKTTNITSTCFDINFGNDCFNFTFGGNIYSNKFGNINFNNVLYSSNHNRWGDRNVGNIMGNNQNNVWGNWNWSNIWGSGNHNNTWGNSNINNMWYDDNTENTWGNGNVENIWINDNDSNTWGNSNSSNLWGSGNIQNKWGEENQNNNWGSSNSSNSWMNFNSSNLWGSGNKYNNWGSFNQLNTWGDSNKFNNWLSANSSNIVNSGFTHTHGGGIYNLDFTSATIVYENYDKYFVKLDGYNYAMWYISGTTMIITGATI